MDDDEWAEVQSCRIAVFGKRAEPLTKAERTEWLHLLGDYDADDLTQALREWSRWIAASKGEHPDFPPGVGRWREAADIVYKARKAKEPPKCCCPEGGRDFHCLVHLSAQFAEPQRPRIALEMVPWGMDENRRRKAAGLDALSGQDWQREFNRRMAEARKPGPGRAAG